MPIADFLSPDNVLIDFDAPSKVRLLKDIAGRAAASLGLPADPIEGELLNREELGSTGTGGGIAIPHARICHIPEDCTAFS